MCTLSRSFLNPAHAGALPEGLLSGDLDTGEMSVKRDWLVESNHKGIPRWIQNIEENEFSLVLLGLEMGLLPALVPAWPDYGFDGEGDFFWSVRGMCVDCYYTFLDCQCPDEN